MKRYIPLLVVLIATGCALIADSFNGGGGSGSGTTVTVATPYVTIGSTKYVAETMWPFTAFFSGSFLDANTCTLTAGTNGSELASCALNAVNAWYSHAATTSIEAEFRAQGVTATPANTSAAGYGIWICDSTNGKLYSIELVTVGSANTPITVPFIQTQSWTLASCAGTPSASTQRVASVQPATYATQHYKLSVSGGTLSFQVSSDGGQTYLTLDSVAVGTISKAGVDLRTTANFTVSATFLSVSIT